MLAWALSVLVKALSIPKAIGRCLFAIALDWFGERTFSFVEFKTPAMIWRHIAGSFDVEWALWDLLHITTRRSEMARRIRADISLVG
jgi:hypothetical protein